MITVEIEGLNELIAAFDPDEFEKRMDAGLWEAAEVLMNTVQGNMPDVSARTTGYGAKGIPVDTGRLKASIERRKVQLLAAEVYAGTDYSRYVHDGTEKVPARPFFQWALQDFGGIGKIEVVLSQHMERALRVKML